MSSDGGCVVGSEVGVTIPVPGVEYASFRFSFRHERISPSDSDEDLRNTARLVHEFNMGELERRVKEFLRDIRDITEEGSANNGTSRAEGSVQARVRQRQEAGKKGSKKKR